MLKKVLMLGIVVILLFSLAGCYPVDKFKSLEEMQNAISDNFSSFEGTKTLNFFDFDQEGVKETGKFQATKRSKEGRYFRYSIWYDVEYEIDGQNQKRKLRVAATDSRDPMNFGYRNTEAFRSVVNQIYGDWLDKIDINEVNWSGAGFDENKKALLFGVSDVYYRYYFNLEGVQTRFIEKELEAFLSIFEVAVINRYQIS